MTKKECQFGFENYSVQTKHEARVGISMVGHRFWGIMARQKAPVAAQEAEKSVRRRIPKWALQTADTASADEQYYLRSIGRALDVLNCFDGRSRLSLKDICVKTKLPESTLFRVLLTLEKHEYLQQDRDGTYQLAPKLLYGWLVQAANRFRDIARPELEKLANRFNETVSSSYLYDDRIHVVDCLETFHEIRLTNKIGRVLPPHCSAMGKAITAFQERALTDRILEVYGLAARTDKTIVDRHKLFQELEEVRRTGVGYDREESNRGGLCIGAAVRSDGLPVVAAISVSTPLVRMTKEREKEIRAAVVETAELISGLMAQQ
jgi:DNA-binding IclR family transcriptional regulator